MGNLVGGTEGRVRKAMRIVDATLDLPGRVRVRARRGGQAMLQAVLQYSR